MLATCTVSSSHDGSIARGFDLGAFISNLFLSFFSQPGHTTPENNRKDFQRWLLITIEQLWHSFEQKFLHLWHTQRTGAVYQETLFPTTQPEATQRATSAYIRRLFEDTLGFSAAKMIRRIVGVAHVADMETIADADLRAKCERRALLFARDVMKQRTDRSVFGRIEQVTAFAVSVEYK